MTKYYLWYCFKEVDAIYKVTDNIIEDYTVKGVYCQTFYKNDINAEHCYLTGTDENFYNQVMFRLNNFPEHYKEITKQEFMVWTLN